MNFILSLGCLLFFISSAYFLIKFKSKINSAFFVSFITLISYLVMLEGSFISSGNYWTRWIGYAFSCSLLIFIISQKVGLNYSKQISVVILNILVMITGALSSTSEGTYKWLFYVISSLAYIKVIYEIYKTKSKNLKIFSPFIIYGWSVFPIIFLFSNEGLGIISAWPAAAIYLLLDAYTKIYFYFKTGLVQNKKLK